MAAILRSSTVPQVIIGAVAGVVTRIKTHPSASKIWLAHVSLGMGQPSVQIVFGGCRKLRRGDLVAVAPPGSRIKMRGWGRPKKMRARRYRGERSHGMLCSLSELGWVESGLDEVAVLRGLRPGHKLDDVPVRDRPSFVKNWFDGVEDVATMVDAVFEPVEASPQTAVSV